MLFSHRALGGMKGNTKIRFSIVRVGLRIVSKRCGMEKLIWTRINADNRGLISPQII